MQPLEKLGIFVLVVIIGLFVYWYIKFIKNGEPLDPSDKDWKKTRDEELFPLLEEYKNWCGENVKKHGEYHTKIDSVYGKMFKQQWNDSRSVWNVIVTALKYIAEKISWNKYWVVYSILILIIVGLILHYVFGV